MRAQRRVRMKFFFKVAFNHFFQHQQKKSESKGQVSSITFFVMLQLGVHPSYQNKIDNKTNFG